MGSLPHCPEGGAIMSTDLRTLCEVWLAMNEDGFFEVGCSEEEAAERMMESHGGRRCRTVMLNVLMLPPQVTKVAVEVPDEDGQTVKADVDDDTDLTRVVDPRQTD
jgi:hypothetical protein